MEWRDRLPICDTTGKSEVITLLLLLLLFLVMNIRARYIFPKKKKSERSSPIIIKVRGILFFLIIFDLDLKKKKNYFA